MKRVVMLIVLVAMLTGCGVKKPTKYVPVPVPCPQPEVPWIDLHDPMVMNRI